MSSTLSDVVNAVKAIEGGHKKKNKIADELLGRYAGVIPKGKTSTQFIKELRGNLYGKIK